MRGDPGACRSDYVNSYGSRRDERQYMRLRREHERGACFHGIPGDGSAVTGGILVYSVKPKPGTVELKLPSRKQFNLSPRMRDIAYLVAEGKAYKEIADDLWTTEAVVKVYVSRLLNKMQFENCRQLAVYTALYL